MGANHMAEQLRGWSPGRAVLPPDPGGHNRMLDRAAAEHLREVAPHLAPSAPAPPQPEPGTCHCGAYTASECECRKQAPPAPPQPEPDRCTSGGPHSYGSSVQGGPDEVCAVCWKDAPPAPPAEAKGEMTPPHGIRCDGCLAGVPHERDRHCYSIAQLMEHIAALRTRAREAEYKAEARQANIVDTNRTLERVVRERDDAREQREAIRKHSSAEIGRLGLEVARFRDDFAAAHGVAREADRMLGIERAARGAAEAERDRLRECHRTAAETVWEVSVARSKVEKALAAAEAEVARLVESQNAR